MVTTGQADSDRISQLVSLHLAGSRDPRGSTLDRVTHAGRALGLLYPELDVELHGVEGADLAAISFTLPHRDGSETRLTFAEVSAGRFERLEEDLQRVAHELGDFCAYEAGACDSCDDRREAVKRQRAEEVREGYGDWLRDEAKDARIGGGL